MHKLFTLLFFISVNTCFGMEKQKSPRRKSPSLEGPEQLILQINLDEHEKEKKLTEKKEHQTLLQTAIAEYQQKQEQLKQEQEQEKLKKKFQKNNASKMPQDKLQPRKGSFKNLEKQKQEREKEKQERLKNLKSDSCWDLSKLQ